MTNSPSSPYAAQTADDEEFVFTDDELLGPRDPKSAPIRRATPGRAIGRYWRNYARFSGRSSRSEYWWVALLNVVVVFGASIVALLVQGATGESLDADVSVPTGLVLTVLTVYLLASFIPGLALGVRRLHDANLAGWFILLLAVFPVSGIIGLVFSLLPPAQLGERFDRRTGAA